MHENRKYISLTKERKKIYQRAQIVKSLENVAASKRTLIDPRLIYKTARKELNMKILKTWEPSYRKINRFKRGKKIKIEPWIWG